MEMGMSERQIGDVDAHGSARSEDGQISVEIRGMRVDSIRLASSVYRSMDGLALGDVLTQLVNEALEEAEQALLRQVAQFDQPAPYRLEELQGELDALRQDLS